MDIATVLGLILGLGLVGWSIIAGAGDRAGGFIDIPSVVLVFGGSVAAALISFPLGKLKGVIRVVRKTFFTKPQDIRALIADLVRYAEVARRDGILSLENLTRDMDDAFVKTGIQMAVDGTDPELIEQVLTSELNAVSERHAQGKALFDNLGKYAPSFGMIGTLVGLVIMLNNMDDPSAIGPGMAIALLTTLYGALIANVIALPLADKLSVRSDEELLHKQIVIRGVIAIQSGDNPRVVEQKLQTFLPLSARAQPKE